MGCQSDALGLHLLSRNPQEQNRLCQLRKGWEPHGNSVLKSPSLQAGGAKLRNLNYFTPRKTKHQPEQAHSLNQPACSQLSPLRSLMRQIVMEMTEKRLGEAANQAEYLHCGDTN